MNAHSAWVKWQEKYRISPPPEAFESMFPCPIRYDWKGVGMEGAFKAGYVASSADLESRKRLAGRLAECESDLDAIKAIVKDDVGAFRTSGVGWPD